MDVSFYMQFWIFQQIVDGDEDDEISSSEGSTINGCEPGEMADSVGGDLEEAMDPHQCFPAGENWFCCFLNSKFNQGLCCACPTQHMLLSCFSLPAEV